MRIEILDTGCEKCNKTKELAEKAIKELSVDAEIMRVEEFDKIPGYGVMTTSTLVIDGDVKVAGEVPSLDEIKKWRKNKQPQKTEIQASKETKFPGFT